MGKMAAMATNFIVIAIFVDYLSIDFKFVTIEAIDPFIFLPVDY
jgi:hypothetical protein